MDFRTVIQQFLFGPIGTPAQPLPNAFEAPALVILLAQQYGPS